MSESERVLSSFDVLSRSTYESGTNDEEDDREDQPHVNGIWMDRLVAGMG